jgi:pimeloyl-ACP methyl ester carboxylesterase
MSQSFIKKAYVDTQYAQIHYRYSIPTKNTTKKSTPIIFLHKSASSSASYESLIRLYSSLGYTCYAPDMPGFSSSFDPSPSDIAEIKIKGTKWFISVFMEAFHLMGLPRDQSRCYVMEHHSGAVLATEIAALYPDFVASICLVGSTVMNAEERAAMKEIFFKPFNEPVLDCAHLLKIWDYLSKIGIGGDLGLWQREAIDHIRAWKGRNLIYGAVWAQDAERIYMDVKCPIMLMCAADDVI